MLGYTKFFKAKDNVHQLETLVSMLQGWATNYDIEIQELQIFCWELETEASNTLAVVQDGIDQQELLLDVKTLEARSVELGASKQSIMAQDVDQHKKVDAIED